MDHELANATVVTYYGRLDRLHERWAAEMYLHQVARMLAIATGLAALALLSLGLLSYTFVAADGFVIEAKTKRVRPVGEYVSGRGGDFAQNATVEDIDVCYRYSAGGPNLESCRIGFGVSHITLAPLSREPWEQLRFNDPVRIYYFRHYPSVAVLHRGPDWILFAGLVVATISLLAGAKKIATLEQPSIGAVKRWHARRARRLKRRLITRGRAS